MTEGIVYVARDGLYPRGAGSVVTLLAVHGEHLPQVSEGGALVAHLDYVPGTGFAKLIGVVEVFDHVGQQCQHVQCKTCAAMENWKSGGSSI